VGTEVPGPVPGVVPGTEVPGVEVVGVIALPVFPPLDRSGLPSRVWGSEPGNISRSASFSVSLMTTRLPKLTMTLRTTGTWVPLWPSEMT
jgi:hypothetical protein